MIHKISFLSNIENNFSVQQNKILKESEKDGSEDETDEDEEDFDLQVNIDSNLVSYLLGIQIRNMKYENGF